MIADIDIFYNVVAISLLNIEVVKKDDHFVLSDGYQSLY